MKIEAAVLRMLNTKLSVETLTLDAPKRGEVLIDMKAAGVCHSDWHCVTGDSVIGLPAVLGHEGSGVIAELGEGVTGLSVGDHVALSWIPFCGSCRECGAGHTHLCTTYLDPLWAGTMLDGTTRLRDASGGRVDHLSALSTWASHAVVPAISCVPMPEVPFEISSLIGCGVTTGVGSVLNRVNVKPGSSVAVFGCGGVGLAVIMAAAYAGAATIIAVDTNAAKEPLARELGATHFVSATNAIEAVQEHTDGVGCDAAFDVVGHPSVEAQLLGCLARRGTAVLVGIPATNTTFEVAAAEFIREEKMLTGSIFGSANTTRDFVQYAELYRKGHLPLDRLITSRYALGEINEACDSMLHGDGGRGVLIL